jgi:hypothetical protein
MPNVDDIMAGSSVFRHQKSRDTRMGQDSGVYRAFWHAFRLVNRKRKAAISARNEPGCQDLDLDGWCVRIWRLGAFIGG